MSKQDEKMQCVILFRNPWNKRVGYVADGESDEMMVYASEELAVIDVPNVPILRAATYQIVRLEEL